MSISFPRESAAQSSTQSSVSSSPTSPRSTHAEWSDSEGVLALSGMRVVEKEEGVRPRSTTTLALVQKTDPKGAVDNICDGNSELTSLMKAAVAGDPLLMGSVEFLRRNDIKVSFSRGTFLVTGADLAGAALAMLRDYEVVFAGKKPTEKDIGALCKQHDPVAIIVRYGKVGAAAMDAAPSLKVISKHGTGTDTIDKHAAAARGIEVVAAVGANAPAVAEHAMALLLACAKSVVELDGRMRQGHWDKASHKSVELAGRTAGVIGLGAIGQRFARMADAMDMRVLGYNPRAKELPGYIKPAELDTIWKESDVISLHCPLTPENAKMINGQTLAACKKGVIIVNTARGGLIDEAALLDAIRSGQVGGAGLDSFAEEPMVESHPFHGESRITLSPHIGGVTADAYVKMGVASVENALAVLRRDPQVSLHHEPMDAVSAGADAEHARRAGPHGAAPVGVVQPSAAGTSLPGLHATGE